MQRTHQALSTQLARPHAITLAMVALLQAAWMPSAANATAPSQNPLISKGLQPAPNVMLTLDTSWSMIFPYIPEGQFTVAGGTVTFPSNTSPILHPKDTRFDSGDGRWLGDGGVIPGDASDTAPLIQMQMRSPDVNALYYDPKIHYKPWLKIDPSTQAKARFPEAVPSMAFFDPTNAIATDPSTYADLTAAPTDIKTYWCTKSPYGANSTNPGKLDCGRGTNGGTLKSFSPGLYYLLDSSLAGCASPADPNYGSCYKKFDINTDTSFTKYPNRDDCLGATCTQDEERRNFANWFVYYRTRLHMAQAAIPEAFINLDNDKIRTGLATIHQETATNIDGVSTTHVMSGVRLLNTQRKTELSDWIRAFRTLNKSTPLRKALQGVGDYFSRTDSGSAWASDPGANTSEATSAMLTCRRAYNVLVTDGYYNDAEPTVGNVDGSDGLTITGPSNKPFTYKANDSSNSLYADKKSNTLADVAMKYWKADIAVNQYDARGRLISSGLDNKVPAGNNTPGQDPAFWQHLVQLPIGLGITGSVPNDSITNLMNFVQANGWWSAPDSGMQKVDDLLHAAVNTRGQYFSAKKPSELSSALTTALNRAARRDGLKQAGVATAVLTTSSSNVKYVPEYTTEQWIGDLKAYSLDAKGVSSDTPKWSASAHLPAPANRNIVTIVGTDSSSPSGVNFFWSADDQTIGASSLDDAGRTLLSQNLPTDAAGADLVSYIRGDSSKEDTALKLNQFRQRESKLGDFVNSTPLVLQGNVNLFYDLLPQGVAPGYADFRTQKAARSRLILAGANDGMLHAFADPTVAQCNDTGTTSPASCGQEVFAYVPRAALSKLGKLAQRDYGTDNNPHQFIVDGPLTESDVYLDSQWKNMVVGTMGAGGRAIFALDVTPGTNLGTSSVMWEKSGDNDEDFGYMMGAAQVGVMADGSWKVFVGNGPYSDKGRAVLMMIDLKTRTVSKIVTDETADNGLGAVRLVKNSNQQVVGVLAGDLKGRLWHFDFGAGNPAEFKKTHLFTTAIDSSGRPQPITAAPSVMSHPLGGYMITFGTGKLYDEADSDDASQQSLYGVWEKATDSTGTATGLTTTNLVEQVIKSTPVASNNERVFYGLEFNKVDYAQSRGWFINLTQAAGQRLIYPGTPLRDFVLFNTTVPVTTAQAKTCDNNGEGFSWILPTLMDGTYDKTVIIDTDGDGAVDKTKDAIASGYRTATDGQGTTLTGGDGKIIDLRTGERVPIQLPGSWKRVWRQLITTPHP